MKIKFHWNSLISLKKFWSLCFSSKIRYLEIVKCYLQLNFKKHTYILWKLIHRKQYSYQYWHKWHIFLCWQFSLQWGKRNYSILRNQENFSLALSHLFFFRLIILAILLKDMECMHTPLCLSIRTTAAFLTWTLRMSKFFQIQFQITKLLSTVTFVFTKKGDGNIATCSFSL